MFGVSGIVVSGAASEIRDLVIAEIVSLLGSEACRGGRLEEKQGERKGDADKR